jgi:hypothetical protein
MAPGTLVEAIAALAPAARIIEGKLQPAKPGREMPYAYVGEPPIGLSKTRRDRKPSGADRRRPPLSDRPNRDVRTIAF